MYEKALENAGLSEKQAKIYFACLELGASKVPEIARKSGVKRTTAYGILDELLSLGLVNISVKGKTKRFQAQEPDVLRHLLEWRKQEIEKILPGLKELFATHHVRPRLQSFEGKTGVKSIFEDSLKNRSKKIYQIVRVRDFLEFLGEEYAAEYIHRRSKNNITAYALHQKSGDILTELFGKESTQWKRHTRFLPSSVFYASMIMIYDNKVAMVSTKKENFGFIIESREFARTLEAYFHFMWSFGSKEPEECERC